MTHLAGDDICQLSAEGMSTEAITRLLILQEVAKLATTVTPMPL